MSTMVPMYGFGGGGGTGAALTVAAPAGVTVTVSKDGKTKTKVSDSSGVAVFKGLETGEWTITITDGEQTAQKTATVTADYAAEITFFAATINVTYPAGSACTATDGTTTLTAPDTSGTWECVVPNAGTWTLTAKDGSYSVSKSVSITTNNQNTSVTIVAELVIFRNGAFGNGFTNNRISTSHVAFRLTNGNLVVKGGTSAINYSLCVKPNVDTTPYSTLKFVAATGGGGYSMGVGDSSADANYTAKYSSNTGYGKKTFSIDVSSVNKSQYIKFKGYEGPNSGAVITIYEIVLLR